MNKPKPTNKVTHRRQNEQEQQGTEDIIKRIRQRVRKGSGRPEEGEKGLEKDGS